jgi:putative transposase
VLVAEPAEPRPAVRLLTEAFLWSELRVVTKTATVSLHANTNRVDPALAGRRVELVFSPFDLETIDVRYRDRSFRPAVPHTISRHIDPKARPDTPDPAPAVTGIDYLALTAPARKTSANPHIVAEPLSAWPML